MAQDKDVPSHDKAARGQENEIQNPQQLNSELARVSAATNADGFVFTVLMIALVRLFKS